MLRKKNRMIFVLFALFLILSNSISFSQFEPDAKPTPQREEKAPPSANNSMLQKIPSGYWIKINAFSTVSIIIILLAFILGFVSYYIGLSAGGDINKREIRKAIISALIIAIFARPIEIMVHYYLGAGLSYLMPDEYAFGIAGFIVYVLWTLYLLAIPVYLYESFTVTAKEAYPIGGRR
jgi:hypothetical protein